MLIHTDNDINYNHETEERPKKNRKEIACCSWTTASGQIKTILPKNFMPESLPMNSTVMSS